MAVKNLFLLDLEYRLRRLFGRKLKRGWIPQHLARLGSPKTVVDVGVGFGTPALYRAFPEAQLILVEPLADYAEHLNRLAEKYRCKVYTCAAGASRERRIIHVDPSSLTKSSLQDRTRLTERSACLEEREIDIVPLDEMLATAEALAEPIALKIDTEGFELDVVRGATELLKKTCLVIAEASIAKRFEDSYTFEELVAEMAGHGFYLFELLRTKHVKHAPGTKFADVVFLNSRYSPRHGSPATR